MVRPGQSSAGKGIPLDMRVGRGILHCASFPGFSERVVAMRITIITLALVLCLAVMAPATANEPVPMPLRMPEPSRGDWTVVMTATAYCYTGHRHS